MSDDAGQIAQAEAVLGRDGGPSASEYIGVPGDFDAALAAAREAADPAGALAQLRSQRLQNVSGLLKQLAGFDKAPVQTGRRRMLRAELNAIARLRA